jgi:ADP-ribose pyrophosphatase YjhB (NUDIX family)
VWQDHFTVSTAAIVTNAERQVLLLDHVLRPFSGWGLPGGFIDHSESPEEAIRREIKEETGIELADLKLFRVRIHGSHVEVLFTAVGVGEPMVKSAEIIGLGWFSLDDLPDGISTSQRATITEVISNDS